MTTTVRVACPSGAGVSVKYGTQTAEVPVGGVHTFYLYEGQQEQAVITELGVVPTLTNSYVPAIDTALVAENDCLKAELASVREQLAAVHKAIGDANGETSTDSQ